MMVARRRQMARLERLAAPRVEQIRVAKAQLEQEMANRIYSDALVHAANLSLIILFGAPRIEEPLSIAWERSCKSVSPELCGDVSRENMLKEYISPFDELGSMLQRKLFWRTRTASPSGHQPTGEACSALRRRAALATLVHPSGAHDGCTRPPIAGSLYDLQISST